jgi:hypothetical protein
LGFWWVANHQKEANEMAVERSGYAAEEESGR